MAVGHDNGSWAQFSWKEEAWRSLIQRALLYNSLTSLSSPKKKKKTLSLCWAGRAILDSIGLYPCVVHHRYFLESISRKSTRKMQKSACHIMRSFWTPRRCRGSGRTKRTSALWVFIDSKAQLTGTWVEAVERRMPLGTHAWVSSLQ